MSWKIEFDGEVYREVDLTIDQSRRIEKLTGATWLTINPYKSAVFAAAILSVMVADKRGVSQEDADKQVAAITVHKYLDMVSTEDDDLPDQYRDGIPLAEDGTGTTGSSGAPAGSTGPLTSPDDSPSVTSD